MGQRVSYSPERLRAIERQLPPDLHNSIPDIEIDEFDKFGKIGWAFFATQLLQSSN